MPRSAPSVSWATCQPGVLGSDEVRDAGITHVVEEHLAEVRLAGRLADRPDVDARRAHVEQEVRDAVALGRVGIGAGEQQAPVGVRGAAGPHLLAVHDVAVALAAGAWSRGWRGRSRPRARRSPGTRSRRRGWPGGAAAAARRCRRRAASTRRGGSTRTPGPAGARRAPPAPGRARPARRWTCPRPTRPASAARRSPRRAAPGTSPAGTTRTRRRTPPVCAARHPAGTWVRHQSRTSPRKVARDRAVTSAPSARAAPAAARRCSSDSIVTASAAKPAWHGPARGPGRGAC